MTESSTSYKKYLNSLKKTELENIIKDYNVLADIYNLTVISIKKDKKDAIVKKILANLEGYFKYIVMSLDIEDYNLLTTFLNNKIDEKEHKEFIDYLVSKYIVINNKKKLELPKYVKNILLDLLNDKGIYNNGVVASDRLYKICDGIILAYGVLDKDSFNTIIDGQISKLEYYYKKSCIIDSKKVASKDITKTDASKFLKKKDLKEFSLDEFYSLGDRTYHHKMKDYKNLIKVIKEYYIFKKDDIKFIDDEILIPFLYSNGKDNDKILNEKIVEYFEFKEDSLKDKLLTLTESIKEEFPVWSKRGYQNSGVIK